MSDDIVVSGGGSVAVASDELLWHAEQLRDLAAEVRRSLSGLASIDSATDGRALGGALGGVEAARAEDAIDSALHQLERVETDAAGLARALLDSAEAYGRAERAALLASEVLTGALADILGFALPLLLLWALPFLTSAASGVLIGSLFTPGGLGGALGALPGILKNNSAALSNPVIVALVRLAVAGSDDAIAGRLGVNPELALLLGDRGLGLTGVDTSAALILALTGRAGVLGETPVRSDRVGVAPLDGSPQSMAERFGRVPSPEENGGAQVRIERYTVPGEPDRFEVYIAGTVDFSPVAGEEPWDMTSNVSGVAGLPAGSYRAVVEALADAGVTAETPVQFTGYSQGGLVAAMLAASGDYDTRGLITFGAPAGNVELPGTFPVIAVEHTEDIVPATGGDQVNSSVIVARRALFAEAEVPTDQLFPAHQRPGYADTARLLDEQHSAALTTAMHSLTDFTAGATGEQSALYSAERVSAGGDPGR